jgi:NAD-dependent dihydropyrimidine dehydrogenase PreA subunit
MEAREHGQEGRGTAARRSLAVLQGPARPALPPAVPARTGLLPHPGAQAAAFLTALGLLAVVQTRGPRPLLLAERFVHGAGWAEAPLLALWAAFLAGKLLEPRLLAPWRRRLWLLFSIVFFAQLALGLAGFERFLMSGRLHVPVPAVIAGGPVYRGEGFFMPVLLGITLLVAGPAWCSYLCYIGAWDLLAASARRKPAALPRWRGAVRVALLAATVLAALGLRLAHAPGPVAAGGAIAFGLAGVAVMARLSRRTGQMVHCTAYCPIGVVTTALGRLSPFRVRIVGDCTDCGACTIPCRYDALRPGDIARRRPGGACTLCGDCLKSCRGGFLQYRFAGLPPEAARRVFFVVVAALHAVFLGVARI